MALDNSPKIRQARDLQRKLGKRQPYQRVLIVCEGAKTERQYFEEIRQEFRLATTNVQVLSSSLGTQPAKVVACAEQLLRKGDRARGIVEKSFDLVFAVFDRDDHTTYHEGLQRAAALDRKIKNDLGELARFHAIASVPCFELWLLLHFEDVQAPVHRNAVYERLKAYLKNYDKGQRGHWTATKGLLAVATDRAKTRALATSAHDGTQPFTSVHELVAAMTQLKQ